MVADKEYRKEARQYVLGHVSYSSGSDSDNSMLEGIIIDLSSTGLGLFTYKCVEEGTDLKIRGNGLWDNSRHATVKWCKKIASDIYRAGLSFN